MADDVLERALRDALTSSVTDVSPQTVDLAGVAIRGGRRRQRRRVLAGGALALVVAAGMSTAMIQLRPAGGGPGQMVVIGDPPEANGVSTPATAQVTPHAIPRSVVAIPRSVGVPPVPVVVNQELRQPDGGRIALGLTGQVEQARRAAVGVLVTERSTTSRRKVWYVEGGHDPTLVLTDVTALTVDSTGRWVAWTSGSTLSVAMIDSGGRTTPEATTNVPAGVSPVRFVGDQLLLRRAGSPDAYALWPFALGAFQPLWNASLASVYGVLSDGRVVAQGHNPAALGRPCLVLVRPVPGLPSDRSVCGLPLAAGGAGVVSPTGRLLLANGVDDQTDDSPGLLSIDLERIFEGALAPAPRPVGPPLAGDSIWTGETSLVYPTADGTLVQASTVTSGSAIQLAAPSQLGGRPLVVAGGS